MTMKTTMAGAFALVLGLVTMGPTAALGYGEGTPDTDPPAEELPCDTAGLRGAAFGLCVAYCEANDCEIQPDKHACEVLRKNYAKITGEDLFPCDDGGGPVQ